MAKARIAIAGAVLIAAVLLAHYAVSWLQVSDLQQRGTDFSSSYVAAVLIRDGDGSRLYDQALEQQTHLSLLPPGTRITLPFVTPPTTALLALPLTWLDLAAASRLFSVLQLVLLIAALWVAIRAAPWPQRLPRGTRPTLALIVLAGVPTFALLLLAQLDGVCALGIAVTYALWRRGHRDLAGIALALGVLSVKPHLAIGLAVFLVARREWRMLAAALAAGVAMSLVCLAVVGPAGVAGFAGAVSFSFDATPAASTVGLPGLIASWFGVGAATTALDVVAIAACLAGCAFIGVRSRGDRRHLEVALLGATALSLVLSPHLLTYDLVVLEPLVAVCLARLLVSRNGRVNWTMASAATGAWVLGNLLANLDLGTAAPAPPGRLTPLALLGAVALTVRSLLPRDRDARSLTRPARLQLGRGSGVGGSVE